MSPAAPSAPRYTWPPRMSPQPMPVPILTKRKSSTLRAVPAWSSPSAMMFTSLSTMTGAPRAAERVSRTGKRFQPGMIGGITGAPSRWLTGPGTPTPTPCSSSAAPSARSLATRSTASCSTTLGPRRTSHGIGGVRDQAQLAVGDRDVDRGGPDVDADEAQGPGEAHEVRAPPPAGLRETLRLDQPELDEPVQLDGDLGLREPHRLAELGAGRLAPVAEQTQQTSLVTVLGPRADSVHPASAPPRAAESSSEVTRFGLRQEDFDQKKFEARRHRDKRRRACTRSGARPGGVLRPLALDARALPQRDEPQDGEQRPEEEHDRHPEARGDRRRPARSQPNA